MDETQVLALITSTLETQLAPTIQGVLDTLQGHLDSQITQLKGELASTARPNNETEAPSEPQGTVKARLAALEAQLAESNKQMEAEKVARQAAEKAQAEAEKARKFDSEFESVLNGYKLLPETREFLVNSLKGQLAGVEEVEGKFVAANGKALDEYVNEFMSTPTGKHFLQSQGNTNGLSSFGTVDKPAINLGTVTEQAVLGAFS